MAATIPTLPKIKDRCTKDGDHFLWKGFFNKKGTPLIWNGTHMVDVRRVVAALAQGAKPKTVFDNLPERAWAECLTPGCCSPLCVKGGNRLEWCAWRRDSGQAKKNLAEAIRHTAIRRSAKDIKLSLDIAREIRQSNKGAAELGREHGVHKSNIYRIRNGERWREHMPGVSIFTMAAAGVSD